MNATLSTIIVFTNNNNNNKYNVDPLNIPINPWISMLITVGNSGLKLVFFFLLLILEMVSKGGGRKRSVEHERSKAEN